MKAALRLTAVFAALLALIALPGCGGRKHSRVAALPGAATTHEQTPVSLDDTLAQLDALARPDGVDEKLWADLTSALRTALTADSHDGKLISKPPTGEANRVTDLEYVELPDTHDSFALQWTYKNAGDYNQDGAVNIGDLTPLALHFGQTVNETNSWVDGNGDGTIGVADIQPLAANFGSEIDLFLIQHAALDGEFSDLSGILFYEVCEMTTVPRKPFAYSQHSNAMELYEGYWRYRVVPIDADGNAGEPSEELVLGRSVEIGPEGGTVVSDDGSITLHVPPGAITDTTIVRLRSYYEGWRVSSVTGRSCIILPEDLRLNLPASLVFNYGDLAADYPEEDLTVSNYVGKANPDSFNEPGYTWVTTNSVCDPASNSITGQIESLGYYSVTQTPAQSTSIVRSPAFLAVNGHYAFGFGGLDGGDLQSFDVSIPTAPIFVSSINTAFSAPNKFKVVGNYGYRTTRGWLCIYDLSDPRNLTEIVSVWIGSYISDYTIVNGYAYFAAEDDLVVVDISNPAFSAIESRLSMPFPAATVGVKGDRAYVGTSGGLYVVDIADPASPSIAAVLPDVGYIQRNICIVGDYAYCGVFMQGLVVLDLSSADGPQILPGLDCEIRNSNAIYASGATLYLPGDESGLQVIDISNPIQPLLQRVINTSAEVSSVFLDGNYAYIGSGDTLIMRLDVPSTTEPASWIPVPGSNWQIDLKGSYLYIAAGDAGLQIVDISDAAHPILTGGAVVPGIATMVSSNGDYAAVWSDGLYIVDARNKSYPVLVGSFISDLNPERMILDGDRVYFMGYFPAQDLRSSGLIIFSIAQPDDPTLLWAGVPEHGITQFGFFVENNYVYCKQTDIYDFTDPMNPLLIAELAMPAQVLDLFIQGGYAYATSYKQLLIIDVSDPSSPAPLSTMAMEGGINRVRAFGTRACMQHWPSMKIIDVSVPAHPVLLGDVGNSQWYSEFALSSHYLYVSTAGGILAKDISTI